MGDQVYIFLNFFHAKICCGYSSEALHEVLLMSTTTYIFVEKYFLVEKKKSYISGAMTFLFIINVILIQYQYGDENIFILYRNGITMYQVMYLLGRHACTHTPNTQMIWHESTK